MNSLYALSNNGNMTFFIGNITPQQCKDIEKALPLVQWNSLNNNEALAEEFEHYIASLFGIRLDAVHIDYVFRISNESLMPNK